MPRPKEKINARLDPDLVEYIKQSEEDGIGFSEKLRRLVIQHKQVFRGNNVMTINVAENRDEDVVIDFGKKKEQEKTD